jgi:3-methyladenine DNA glycosylase AlkD
MDYLVTLRDKFKAAENPERAVQMHKYLKGLFPFYGINKAAKTIIEKDFFKEYGFPPREKLFEVVFELWQLPEREYQYTAIIILHKFEKNLEEKDIKHIEKLIVSKSWWDSVDALSAWICGAYFIKYPEQIKRVTRKWVDSENMWLQRSALLFQLKYKKSTNTELLSEFIEKLSDSKEFFIRKAIGWILREYSKVNPDWVRGFVSTHQLSGLSLREASKYI